MLNLWKKIQEKGHANAASPKRKETAVTSLDPRYDGPLRGFELNADDVVPLEKCYLNPNFDDICNDNKMGYNYFKNFLETKIAATEILNLWSRISTRNSCYESTLAKHEAAVALGNCISGGAAVAAVGNVGESNASILTPFVNEKLGRQPEHLRNKIVSLANKSNWDDLSEADMNALQPVTSEILHEYWNEFVRSEWYCRYQVDLLTSRAVTLGDVLQHDTTLSYFIQFLETEGCQYTVEFWFAATYHEKFVRNSIESGNYDLEKSRALSEAINIYEKYLSLQATCPLGFSDHVRCAVEEAICDETNGPHFDCFKPAHYVHLLSDMIRHSTALANNSPTSSISEFSVESRLPLLNKLDPDSIWRRRKQSGLSFGRIDQFGRFRRDIEPDPGRNNESKISKMMKKWVQRSENKVEEEMAWQVAEMVVKDVIDLTMGCSGDADGVEED